jgi:hypothetical protein
MFSLLVEDQHKQFEIEWILQCYGEWTELTADAMKVNLGFYGL